MSWRLLCLCLVLMSPGLFAQTMEQNEWRFLIEDIPDNRLVWLLGHPSHQPDQDYYDLLGRDLYPGGKVDRSSVLNCAPSLGGMPFKLPKADADYFLSEAKKTQIWFGNNGFEPFGQRFNIVPEVKYRGQIEREEAVVDDFDITGNFVNLLVCKQGGYFQVKRMGSPLQSNKLEFGPRALSMKRHRPARTSAIAHEFSHIYQNNTIPANYSKGEHGPAIKSLLEGMADATAIWSVFKRFGSRQATLTHPDMRGRSDPFSKRFYMLRAYNVPLQLSEQDQLGLDPASAASNDKGRALINAIDAKSRKLFTYETNGFYFHLIERYMGGVAGSITPLYNSIFRAATFNIYPRLDDWLDRLDGPVMKGLEHVLPQFLTEYAGWWEYRTAGRVSEKEWLNVAFGGCPEITLDENETVGFETTDFTRFAGGCFDVVLTGDLLNRAPEVELIVTTESGNERAVYMGLARATGLESGDLSCYEVVEKKRTPFPAACLLDPVDGTINWTSGSLPGGPARKFQLGPIIASGEEDVVLRLILTDVPIGMVGQDGTVANASTYRLIAGVDSSVVEGPGIPPADPGDVPMSGSGPGVIPAKGALQPMGEADASTASLAEAFAGQIEIPGFSMLENIDGADLRQTLFLVDTSNDEVDGPTVGFLQKKPLPLGAVGVFETFGHYSTNAGEFGIQDPEKPSRLEILQNDLDALRYRGEIHVCIVDRFVLMRMTSEDEPRICDVGRRESYFLENTVAFPGLLPGMRSGQPGFTILPRTPQFDQYKNLRLSRIGQALGSYPDPSITDPLPPPVLNGAQPVGPGSDSAGAGECSVRTADRNCDCSCESHICFETLRDMNSLSSADKSCRFTCSKRWQQCQ